ncbi:MAG: translation initiation factor IF-2 [Chitinophagaceae bacterium]|nr:translation initiation factor IF-2 [Chitinophagaceae bacterium]
MATENTTPRLLAAAKEFNIGKETLIEFLTNKNFEVNASNPNTKLTEEMYFALQAEFAKDKLVKKKSDEIALPKGQSTDARKKAAEQADTAAPKAAKTEPAAVAPVAKEKESKTTIEAPKVGIKVVGKLEEKPAAEKAEKAAAKKAVAEEEPQEAAPEVQAESPKEEAEHIGVKPQKVDGPNILGKINLDDLNQSTRPKKSAKKKDEEEATEKPVAKKAAKEKVAEEEKEEAAPKKKATKPAAEEGGTEEVSAPVQETPKEAPEVKPAATTASPAAESDENRQEHIEMKAPKLEGPKIIGKIELPLNTGSDSRDSREKRNRKRIPVQKKPETFRPDQRGQAGGGQGTGRPPAGPGAPRQSGTGPMGNNRPQGTGYGNRQNNDRRGPGGAGGGRFQPQQPQEIDAKQIQKKIHETQNKLAGGAGRGNTKAQKAKYRRDKREMMAEKRAAAEHEDGQVLKVTEFISVSEFANILDVPFTDVISKCMSLGIMVSINQRLDAEIIELVASEYNYAVEFINLDQNEEEEEEEVDAPEDMTERAPIVTIMGHVDHGKTSLLDYIREANVVAGEAGGITQHIGAYQVKTKTGKRITFLDTPGHEAFTAMRARGAKVADVAVIVVAADDAIMPQTREAISHAQAANLPMIFAINKMDKDGANPEKIKEQLAGMNILVEDWGGKFQSQEISAKKGTNIDLLLEKIGLESELLELKANPDKYATGSVIEASLDKGRGYVSTVLVQNGTLHQGEMILCGQYYGKIKAMFNERGQRVEKAGPSTPVQILGLNGAPQAGEKFKQYDDENEAKNIATHRAQILREQGIRARKHITLDEIGRRLALGNFKELAIIIKGDFDGSVEALSDSLQKLSTEEVAVNIVHKGVGQITESDVLLATASDAIIIGFQVRPSSQAGKLADQENIEIRNYSIIYDAIQDVKSAMEGLLEPKVEKKVVANIEVREVYKIGGVGTIAGCYVLDGKMTRNTKLNVIRQGIVVHSGELSSLKRFKDDVKEVNNGYECGLMIKNYNDIQVGDIVEGYDEVETKRTL